MKERLSSFQLEEVLGWILRPNQVTRYSTLGVVGVNGKCLLEVSSLLNSLNTSAFLRTPSWINLGLHCPIAHSNKHWKQESRGLPLNI